MHKLSIIALFAVPIIFLGAMVYYLETGWGINDRNIIERVSKTAAETKR